MKAETGDHLERWDTPIPAVDEHVQHLLSLGILRTHYVDPFAGDGRYGERMRLAGVKVPIYSSDIASRGPSVSTLDYRDDPKRYRGAVVIANPAFSVGFASILFAFQHGARAVSLLLPISFVDPFVKARRAYTVAHPPSFEHRLGRINFEGPARDEYIARKGKPPGAMMQYVVATWRWRIDVPNRTITTWTSEERIAELHPNKK